MPTAPAIPPIGVAAGAAGAATAAAGATALKATSSASGGNGGYVFTPEEIDEVIKQWEGLLDDIMRDEEEAWRIAGVKAPGLEFASTDFEGAASPSGEALLEQIQRMQRYVSDYIDALKKAKEATKAQDETAASDTRNAAGDSA